MRLVKLVVAILFGIACASGVSRTDYSPWPEFLALAGWTALAYFLVSATGWLFTRRIRMRKAQALMLLATAIDERERLVAKQIALRYGVVATEDDDAAWRANLRAMGGSPD